MEFKSQICTTKEQSERLLKMGLSKATADCSICKLGGKFIPEFEDIFLGQPPTSSSFPAWSLHRLMEIAKQIAISSPITVDKIYDEIISSIKSLIHLGYIKEEYLDMNIVNTNEEENMKLLKEGGK